MTGHFYFFFKTKLTQNDKQNDLLEAGVLHCIAYKTVPFSNRGWHSACICRKHQEALFCAIFNPVQSTFLVLNHVLSLTCFSLFSLIHAPSHSDSCWLLLCQRVPQSCWFGCGPLLFFRRLKSSFKHKHLHCSFLPSWLALIHSGFVILTLLSNYTLQTERQLPGNVTTNSC